MHLDYITKAQTIRDARVVNKSETHFAGLEPEPVDSLAEPLGGPVGPSMGDSVGSTTLQTGESYSMHV